MISAAACMAPIISATIMLILLGSIVNLSVGEAFYGGILPGVLMYVALLATSRYLLIHNLPTEPRVTPSRKKKPSLMAPYPLGAPF